jgi:putative membrane protein
MTTRSCFKLLLSVAGFAFMVSSAHPQASAPVRTAAGTSASMPAAATKVSRGDRQFFVTAAEDGMAEVELGKLAQTKGSNDQVKSFGTQMVTDHTNAAGELKALAGSKGVTLPGTPGKHQKDIDKLAKKSGADFDRDYARHMVDAHKKAVALFERSAKGADDADVKALAAKTLPTLRQHLEQAKTLEAAVRGGKKAG